VAGPGHGSLAHQLTDRWPSFAAYAVSFSTIGIIWVNDHALFKGIAAVDRLLVFANLSLLLFVVLIPFATTMATYLRGGGSGAHLVAAIYGLVYEGTSLAFFALFWYPIRHELLVVPIPPDAQRAAILRFCLGSGAYLAVVGIAFVSPAAALALTGLIAVYYVVDRTSSAARITPQLEG